MSVIVKQLAKTCIVTGLCDSQLQVALQAMGAQLKPTLGGFVFEPSQTLSLDNWKHIHRLAAREMAILADKPNKPRKRKSEEEKQAAKAGKRAKLDKPEEKKTQPAPAPAPVAAVPKPKPQFGALAALAAAKDGSADYMKALQQLEQEYNQAALAAAPARLPIDVDADADSDDSDSDADMKDVPPLLVGGPLPPPPAPAAAPQPQQKKERKKVTPEERKKKEADKFQKLAQPVPKADAKWIGQIGLVSQIQCPDCTNVVRSPHNGKSECLEAPCLSCVFPHKTKWLCPECDEKKRDLRAAYGRDRRARHKAHLAARLQHSDKFDTNPES